MLTAGEGSQSPLIVMAIVQPARSGEQVVRLAGRLAASGDS